MNDAADPLAELRDIITAPLPSLWPPAPGWWVLVAVFTVLVLLAIRRLWQLYQRWQRRRFALQQLDQLHSAWQSNSDNRAFAAGLSILLRRVALTCFPRHDVAALSSERWLQFLDQTGGEGGFNREPGRLLASAPYVPNPHLDASHLYQLAKAWIKRNL